jgi:hypothetical protein
MKLKGTAPIQGIDTYDGWLLYFRCRSDMQLKAWSPGTWNEESSPENAIENISDEDWFAPDIQLTSDDLQNELQSCPVRWDMGKIERALNILLGKFYRKAEDYFKMREHQASK